MKKRISALLLALALALSLSACGSSGSSGGMAAPAAEKAASAADGYYYDNAAYEDGDGAVEPEMEAGNGDSGQSGEGEQNSAYQNAQVKLIRRASIRLETKEFDAAVEGLESLVKELNGYVENSNLNQGSYGSTYRSASYTVRVPAQKYSDFLSRMSAEEHCHLVSKDESTEDVGQEYFDTETRLKTLRTKLERLQTLLAKAERMEDIITLEDAIGNTEYEIDRYTSTLNRYDSLIGYATFNVTIDQVVTITDTDTISFGQRLANSFFGGLEDFWEAVQEFLVWVVGHVMGIVVFLLLILLARVLLRRARKRREKKLAQGGNQPQWRQRRNAVPPAPWMNQEPPVTTPENVAAEEAESPAPGENAPIEPENNENTEE